MPLYSYAAMNAQGETVRGTLNAPTLNDANMQLRAQNLQPQEVFQFSYDSASAPPSPAATPTPIPTGIPVAQHTPVPVDLPHAQAPAYDWTAAATQQTEPQYYPIVDTLRLYAGWLLAWYALVYAFGYYTTTRELPFEIPYLNGIYYSPLVLSFTAGSFLFLLVTSIHRLAGRGFVRGLLLGTIGIAAFVLYRVNV